jgi:hypothetical protein
MSNSDRKRLLVAAGDLADALRESNVPSLKIAGPFKIDQDSNYCDGWSIVIATWRGRPRIVLTLDRFLNRPQRQFWFGFYSSTRSKIELLVHDLPAELRPGKNRFETSDTTERNGSSLLKQRRPAAFFDSPILEFYGAWNEYDFGMYDLSEQLTISRAVRFLAGVVDSVDSDAEDVSFQVRQLLRDNTINATTKAQLIQARIGQGQFRERLLNLWSGACAITGCTVKHILRASHIKPWKDSSNEERLDPDNGLLLTANLDALFDKHLISFDEDGRMLVAKQIGNSELKALGLPQHMKRSLNDQQRSYLALHRATHLERAEMLPLDRSR